MNLEDQTMSDIAEFVSAEVYASQGLPTDHPAFRSSVERAWRDYAVLVNEARRSRYGLAPLFLVPRRKYSRQISRAVTGWVRSRSDQLRLQLEIGIDYRGTYWPRDASADSEPASSPRTSEFKLVSFEQGVLRIIQHGEIEATAVHLRDVVKVERLSLVTEDS